MITELTNEQKALMETYRKKGIEIGIDTTEVSDADIQDAVNCIYKHILKKDVPEIKITASPQAAWNAVREHSNNKDMEYIHPYIDGHIFSYFFAYYDYMSEVLDVEYSVQKQYDELRKCLKFGNMYPLEDVCIVSKKPVEVHFVDGNYHNENGMAVRYEDGFGIYMLNGVNVPEWLVMTPVEEMEATKFAEIKNVEVRREFIRKIGIEHLVDELDCELLDKQDDYELVLIDLGGDTGKWPYLKMKNPSLENTWHIEAVGEECKTVEDALKFRNGSDLKPVQLT